MRRDAAKPISKILSENVLELRSGAGMTQEQLAKAARLPRSTIANVEGERYDMPRAKVLAKIAVALKVTVADLLTGKPHREVSHASR